MNGPQTQDSFLISDPSRFRVALDIRYADLDPNHHVNHARYLIYLEEARLALRRDLAADPGLPDDVAWPVAELTIRYRRSTAYPGQLMVELAPIHVGRTAFTLGYGLFDRDGCVVTAVNRSVCVQQSNGQPVPIDPKVAARLRQMGSIA